MNKRIDLRRLVLLSVFAAIAYIMVALIRIPVVLFLKYEPKDVIITVAGFLMGPLSSLIISAVVSLIEMVSISDTGFIGCLMNLLSTCSFACIAALVYKKKHSLWGAVLGLAVGTVSMVTVMLLWNWLVTPIYMGYPREAVEALLLPAFLPFNLLKAGLNSALVLGLYKPLTAALRSSRLLPPSDPSKKKSAKPGIYIFAALLLATCTLLLLVLQGKI